MVEPITTGVLVAGVLAAGAKAFAESALAPAGKAAFEALKSLAARVAGPQVASLEVRPASTHSAGAVAEVVDEQPDALKAEFRALAEALRTALVAEGHSATIDNRVTVIATHGGMAAGRDQIIGAPPKPASDR